MRGQLKYPENVLELEMLLQSYYSAAMLTDATQCRSDQHRAALHRLVRNGLVELYNERINVTEMGRFYVQHLLTVPYPETAFRIPEQ